jgi:predicted amidohydrolase
MEAVMKDLLNIGVVNFKTVWGDKSANLAHMEAYVTEAAGRGCEFIVFPETALTGYSSEPDVPYEKKMHVVNAETIPGPATEKMAELAKKYHMFIVFGMPEKSGDVVYNSAAIIHPDGTTESYRKLHLPFDESGWAVRGDEPKLIDTPWGPVGITICYDTYCFPEIIRYYRAKGARLTLNVTACPDAPCTLGSAQLGLPAYALVNYIYIASSKIIGQEKQNHFAGGSGVIGPVSGGAKAFVGHTFSDADREEEGLFSGVIDLSLADKNAEIPIFRRNEKGQMDWRHDLYARMYERIE